MDLWTSRKVACCALEGEGIKKRNEKKGWIHTEVRYTCLRKASPVRFSYFDDEWFRVIIRQIALAATCTTPEISMASRLANQTSVSKPYFIVAPLFFRAATDTIP